MYKMVTEDSYIIYQGKNGFKIARIFKGTFIKILDIRASHESFCIAQDINHDKVYFHIPKHIIRDLTKEERWRLIGELL